MLTIIFHLSVTVINSFTCWYDQMYVEFPFKKEILVQNFPLKNRVLFLTWWCLSLQTIYFFTAFLNDIIGTNEPFPKKKPLIRTIKDHLFSIALPTALYVFLTFWGIYAIDKDLIFPEEVEKAFPVWCNHVMHTFIAPFILLELLLTPRNYPKKQIGIALNLTYNISYLFVLNLAYIKTGVWVYPVFDVLNWPLRIVFFSASVGFAIFAYLVGEKINSLVSTSPRKEIDVKKTR